MITARSYLAPHCVFPIPLSVLVPVTPSSPLFLVPVVVPVPLPPFTGSKKLRSWSVRDGWRGEGVGVVCGMHCYCVISVALYCLGLDPVRPVWIRGEDARDVRCKSFRGQTSIHYGRPRASGVTDIAIALYSFELTTWHRNPICRCFLFPRLLESLPY